MLKKIQHIDEVVLGKMDHIRTGRFTFVMRNISRLGNKGFIWFVFIIPFFATKYGRIVGTNIFISMSLTCVVGEGCLKYVVGRERPCSKFDDTQQLIERPKYYSFPSGHTASSFSVFAVAFALCDIYVWLPVLLFATVMGFSRVYLRVHYLSDVLAGIVLGIVCGTISVFVSNAAYYKLSSLIFKNLPKNRIISVNGRPMYIEHAVSLGIVWLVIAVCGGILFWHFNKRDR